MFAICVVFDIFIHFIVFLGHLSFGLILFYIAITCLRMATQPGCGSISQSFIQLAPFVSASCWLISMKPPKLFDDISHFLHARPQSLTYHFLLALRQVQEPLEHLSI